MTKTAELRKHDVTLLMDSTSIQAIESDTKILPTDVHAVTYVEDGIVKVDAVRAYKMADIFDAYWDFGIRDIKSIVSGFGNIKPKLYNPNPDKKDSK